MIGADKTTDTTSAELDEAVEADAAEADSVEAVTSEAGGPLLLAGDLGIAQVQELYQQLADAMASVGPVVIDASELRQVDTAVVQVLLAFVRSARKQDRSIAWLGISHALREAAELIGVDADMAFPQ